MPTLARPDHQHIAAQSSATDAKNAVTAIRVPGNCSRSTPLQYSATVVPGASSIE